MNDGSGFGGRISLGCFINFFLAIETQMKNQISHEQRLHLKKDGRPCPKIQYKGGTSQSVYENIPWICGGETEEGKSTYFCWPCSIMGDINGKFVL